MGSSKLFYAVSGAPQHDRQPHPETAKRVPAILAALERAGVTSPAHAGKVLTHHMSHVTLTVVVLGSRLNTDVFAVENDTRVQIGYN